MYTDFYGLREKPFSLSPDPRYLYLSDPHREALAHLLYGIEQGEGFIAITGEVGTGKTTLCRTLLQRLEPGTEVAFIFNPQLTGLELMQGIHAELGLESEGLGRRELVEQLNRFLLAKKREGRRVLLIVDEAQNLEADALEQVRLLSNLETDTEKLIQIILIGQPELDTKLESPELRQLRQRISVRWRLQPLSANDTREYIKHRLRIAAGAPRELFTDLAMREIHRRSQGIPRVINLLCDRALLAGFAGEVESIGLGLVAQSEREMRGGGQPLAQRVAERRPALPRAAVWVAAAALLLLAGGGLWALLARDDSTADAPPPVASAPLNPVTPSAAAEHPAATARPEDTARAESPDRGADPFAALSTSRPASPLAAVDPGAASAPDPAAPALPPPFGTALVRASPGRATAASVDALFDAWGFTPVGAEFLTFEQARAAISGEGLELEPLQGATLDELRALNQPALLSLEALDGARRLVLLERLEGGSAFVGGLGERPLLVPAGELEEVWNGDAWVSWRDFESLPGVLRPGSKGPAVAWLQHQLGKLGYYSEAPTGAFDGPTILAVRSLQQRLSLPVDGTVGARTKLGLYGALPEYTVPRLDPATSLAADARS